MKAWETLVAEAQSGDLDSFGGLVREFQDMAVGYACSQLGDFDLAEDAAQEAFIQAYRDLASLQQPKAFPAWLRRLVLTQCVRMKRGKRLRTAPMEAARDVASPQPTPSERAQQREIQERVLEAIRSLPEHERSATFLFYINGYSMAEVGEFLEAPVSTIKSRLHSARGKLRERMGDMVEKTLKQHAPGEAFAERIKKILSDVPLLDWTKGKLCTFMGALEAATSVTEHPCPYTDLMGFSGVAFRLRWSNCDTKTGWCGSCPIGEMPEEYAAVTRATGWQAPTDMQWGQPTPDHDAIWSKAKASIDAGRPVIAYPDNLDMALIYGYEDEGRILLFRDYYHGDRLHALPVTKIGPMQTYLGGHAEAQPPREALLEALRIAVRNWRRGKGDGGVPGREYWHGDSAFEVWINDLARANQGALSDEEMGKFFRLHIWVLPSLRDARQAARTFLMDHAHLLDGAPRQAVERAAALYAEELQAFAVPDSGSIFLILSEGKTIADWTPEVRERTRQMLIQARGLENQAIAELEKALG